MFGVVKMGMFCWDKFGFVGINLGRICWGFIEFNLNFVWVVEMRVFVGISLSPILLSFLEYGERG